MLNIARCTECNHPDYEHDEQQAHGAANCSFGWCNCSQIREDVRASGAPVTIQPVPAFDHATGKWATR